MDCKEFRELLDLYVDGELSAEAEGAARLHLKQCASCAGAETQMRRLRRALRRAVLRHEPPPGLEGEVRRSMRGRVRVWSSSGSAARRGGRPRDLSKIWRAKVSLPLPVFTLLVAVVLTLGVWLAFARGAEPVPAPASAKPQEPSAVPAPSAGTPGEFDFSRFYRGERASIQVVRRAAPAGAGR